MNREQMHFLREAILLSRLSKDPSTKNSAIIVKDYQIIGAGVNEFPNNVVYTSERLERPLKYAFMGHAERNAIYDTIRNGQKKRS